MKKIGIYSVADDYIDFLRNDKLLSNVYDNKKNHRTHTRKYIGPVFQKDGLKFYIPLSSPKNNDYEIINNKKVIRGDYPFIIRLTKISASGNFIKLYALSPPLPCVWAAFLIYGFFGSVIHQP